MRQRTEVGRRKTEVLIHQLITYTLRLTPYNLYLTAINLQLYSRASIRSAIFTASATYFLQLV